MFTKVLSINDMSFFFGMLGNEEARLPSENGGEKKKEKRKSPWTKQHCALHTLVIVMIFIDGFLVNFESSQFANQNWNCPPSPFGPGHYGSL